ncbi:MAG: TOBE domain-containing protein, partial [Actinomycetota bacterium]
LRALADVEAEALAPVKPDRLSGGLAQRVAFARALVASPRLLLLDEPFAGLDVLSRTSLRALLRRRLASFSGVTILVTHDPVDAMTLASRLVLIEDGRVSQSGTPAEVRAAPRTPYAADLVGINLFRGELVAAGETAEISTSAGRVSCIAPPGVTLPAPDAIGVLRPVDVSLYLTRPQGSARNVFQGPVRSVSIEGDRARIGIQSAPPLTAEITTASLRQLGISEGVTVWASFKALEVRVILP